MNALMSHASEVNARVAALLDDLIKSESARLIVFHPIPCGLGGQISGRVHTLALALALGRRPVFLRPDDPPYAQTFDPVPLPVVLPSDPAHLPEAALDSAGDEPAEAYDPLRTSPTHLAMIVRAVEQKLNLSIGRIERLHGAILEWLRPTRAMAEMVEAERARLGIDGGTLGVHFRRGDKNVETAYVPAAEFNRQIALMHSVWPFTSLFLASDSPAAPNQINCPPGVRLIFDEREKRYNNANHKMLISSPALAEEETRSAWKNIALLGACGGIIGQDNAHFAIIAAAKIVGQGQPDERIAIIDGRFAEDRFALVALWFRAKTRLRRWARVILPHRTTRKRISQANPQKFENSISKFD